jgi:hypothetical protein
LVTTKSHQSLSGASAEIESLPFGRFRDEENHGEPDQRRYVSDTLISRAVGAEEPRQESQ